MTTIASPTSTAPAGSASARPLVHRLALPAILLVICCGVASPFVISGIKHRALAANETAAIESIKTYVQAQERRRTEAGPGGEYARNFDQLSLQERFPDIDDANSPPLHGYRFRILTSSNEAQWQDKEGRMNGGYGLLAVPADYMVTARDTFLVSGSDIYMVDYGVRTTQLTRELRSFNVPPNAEKVISR